MSHWWMKRARCWRTWRFSQRNQEVAFRTCNLVYLSDSAVFYGAIVEGRTLFLKKSIAAKLPAKTRKWAAKAAWVLLGESQLEPVEPEAVVDS